MLVNKVKQSIKINISPRYHIVDTYSCLHNSELTCLEGFTWNGSNLIKNTEKNRNPSMFHDCSYGYLSLGWLPKRYRKMFDIKYRTMLIENGVNKYWAWAQYAGVRILGWMWI